MPNCWFRSPERVPRGNCSLKTADLTNDAIEILGIHFSYHNETKTEQNFLNTVKKIQSAFNVQNTRKLTLKGRILIFKKLEISKIVYVSLITIVPNSFLNEIQKIQKAFLQYFSRLKINYKTLCNMFEKGGLKNVDIKAK